MLVVNHQWLQTWLDATIPSPDLVDDFLLRQGFETEPVAPVFTQDIVIGEIIKVRKHPNADKLNLCSVRINDQTTVEIVCGCPSVKVGIKVATALDGATLGTFKIEKRKIRGVLSNGMLCSMQELGLKVSSSGIWHLNVQAPLGQSLDSWLQRSLSTYGIELTPNRGDCLSVRGMAREFAIGLNGQSSEPWDVASKPEFLSLPAQKPIRIEEKVASLIDEFHLVKLDKTGPAAAPEAQTPDWRKVRLVEAGFSLHHCVVDILNYAMLETGQPFHAYSGKLSDDFGLRFGQGQTEMLLNGEKAEVNPQTLVIENESRPVCIAGYMGMLESASCETDDSIYLEAAGFQSSQIAFHCRHYPWHTQSGSRFERGIDFGYTSKAMQRAIDLLVTYAGYKPQSRSYVKGTASQPKVIQLPYRLVADILGFDCPEDKIQAALIKVGCQLKGLKAHCEVNAPSWRNDLQIPESLVSEYLRIYGMPKSIQRGIKATLNVSTSVHSIADQAIDQLKQFMVGQGFYETYNYSFGDESEMCAFHTDGDTLVKLRNPISSAFKTMRPSLLPGLMRQIKKNLAKQVTDVRLFEVGQCFTRDPSGSIVEQCILSAVMTGSVLPESWQDGGALCFAHAKSIMQQAVHRLPLRHDQKLAWHPAVIVGMHPHQSGQLVSGDSVVGQCGLVHPEIIKKMKIQQDVFAFSISMDWLIAHLGHEIYRSVSNQPTMRRDLSLIVPESVPYEKIKEEIQSSIFQYLIKIVIFDIYRGSQIPDGCYSMSLGLIFQSEEKTLVDEELVPMISSLVANLHNKLNIKTRGGND